MEEIKEILRKYFDLNKSKKILDSTKTVELNRLKYVVNNKINRDYLKKIALEEMQTSNKGDMYKLFCQCVTLMGKV